MSKTNDLKQNLADLHSNLHGALIALNHIMEALGASTEPPEEPIKKPDTGGKTLNKDPQRKTYRGLTDGEFGLFEVWNRYNADPENFPGLVAHPSSWEHEFMEDWLSKESVEYNLTPRQEKIFEKIGEKLSYSIHHKPYEPTSKENDYFEDDIPF